MKFSVKVNILVCGILLANFALTSCKPEETVKAKVPQNSFSMRINGESWLPWQNPTDTCISTFSGISGSLVTSREIPMYTFYAHYDPNGRNDAYSQNLLRMRVMDVTEPGIYTLDGTYKEDFDSYIIFVMQQPVGPSKFYVNNPRRRPFVVTMDEITYRQYSSIPSIKGRFAGVLYNEANATDSLIIEQGRFVFKYLGTKNHCD